MNRRQYLASIGGIAGTSIAGCTAFKNSTVLSPPTPQHDGQSVYYRYEHENKEILRVSFNTESEAPAVQRVRAYIEQPGDTVLESYRFRFKPGSSEPGLQMEVPDTAATIYVRSPPVEDADEFKTFRDRGWAIIEGEYEDDRRVTTQIQILVHGAVQTKGGPPPLLVDYEVNLSEDRYFDDTFIARDQQEVGFQPSV